MSINQISIKRANQIRYIEMVVIQSLIVITYATDNDKICESRKFSKSTSQNFEIPKFYRPPDRRKIFFHIVYQIVIFLSLITRFGISIALTSVTSVSRVQRLGIQRLGFGAAAGQQKREVEIESDKNE